MSDNDWYYDWKAWLICHEYNFAPIAGLKFEEVLPTDDIGSQFFANTSNEIKAHIQYNVSELPTPD